MRVEKKKLLPIKLKAVYTTLYLSSVYIQFSKCNLVITFEKWSHLLKLFWQFLSEQWGEKISWKPGHRRRNFIQASMRNAIAEKKYDNCEERSKANWTFPQAAAHTVFIEKSKVKLRAILITLGRAPRHSV